MDALSGKERIARAAGMLQWTRGILARKVKSELGNVSKERLKWEVALRLYGSDRATCELIERKLADVSS